MPPQAIMIEFQENEAKAFWKTGFICAVPHEGATLHEQLFGAPPYQ
jgi:hypothetical protein